MTDLLARSVDSIRKKGMARTFQSLLSIIEDYYFDLKYGTDTTEIVKVENLDIADEDKEHSVQYQPTRIRHFKNLLKELKFPEGSVFVDFGSGKGRVLLATSNYGFKRVVGVEISGHLCKIAKNNLAAYEKRLGRSVPVEIVQSNVLQYNIHEDENIFYFYRPFDGWIMEKMADKIIDSVEESPRKIWLIINSSIYDDLFKAKQMFYRLLYFPYGGVEFVVYETH